MNILFKQKKSSDFDSLSEYGISNCYFKRISFNKDSTSITKKAHHHTGFEIHIVVEGFQEYEALGKIYKLDEGSFLILPPCTRHTFISSSAHMLKYAFTFDKKLDKKLSCIKGKVSDRILSTLDFTAREKAFKKEISETLIENAVLEVLVSLFRLIGVEESKSVKEDEENGLTSLAKQYIDDNIESSPTVLEVAEYCHLSTKQFTRIFHTHEGKTPGEYIIKKRVERTEALLEKGLSLKEISERMNFGSEYYFNTFFTRHAGITPGKYRKMLGK